MSVNILDQNGNLKKIAHGFSESKFNTFRSDVISNIEMTDTASKDYAVGDFLIMANGQLAQVTSPIYQDMTISLSNVRLTTVEEMIAAKADKVTSAVDGNFAGLDSNGNLTDSGHKHSDYLTQHQDISGKADKVTGATNGNLAKLDANGNLADGGWSSDKTTTSATGNPISISGLKSNQLAVNPIITFEPIQAGSGTPSPSNIRAISGYDKIEVLSCGVNVWDEVWELGELNAQGQNASSTTKIRSKNYIPVVGGSTYYLKLSSASAQVFICFYDVNKTFISSNTPYQGTFTVPLMARYCRFNCPATYGTTYNNDMGINYPAAQTSYVSSNKTTDLSESLRRMVYGFTLDLRTGKAIVNKPKSITVDSLTWTYSSGSGRFWSNVIADADLSGQYTTNELLCSRLPTLNTYGTAERGICLHTDGRCYIYDPNVTDTTTLNNTYGQAEIVYTVATPIEIDVTPHEIGLLKDYTYVSTNGTSISLDYHNGELASLGDVAQVGETVNELGKAPIVKIFEVPIANVVISSYYKIVATGIDKTLYSPISVIEGAAWDEKCNILVGTQVDGEIALHIRCIEASHTIPSNASPIKVMCVKKERII